MGMFMNNTLKAALIVLIMAMAMISACGQKRAGEIAMDRPDYDKETPSTAQEPPVRVEESPTKADEPLATQPPFVVPEGYQMVEANAFTVAVPVDWRIEKGYFQDFFYFLLNDKKIGETEILGWFDAETWKDFKPNHSEQTDFRQRDDLLAIQNGEVHLYSIRLIHTKPAAELDPDWRYDETRWYVTVKESGLSYGFLFSSEDVAESVMETILSSFRLNGAINGF
jgi:predicted small lipoprotein YifL